MQVKANGHAMYRTYLIMPTVEEEPLDREKYAYSVNFSPYDDHQSKHTQAPLEPHKYIESLNLSQTKWFILPSYVVDVIPCG